MGLPLQRGRLFNFLGESHGKLKRSPPCLGVVFSPCGLGFSGFAWGRLDSGRNLISVGSFQAPASGSWAKQKKHEGDWTIWPVGPVMKGAGKLVASLRPKKGSARRWGNRCKALPGGVLPTPSRFSGLPGVVARPGHFRGPRFGPRVEGFLAEKATAWKKLLDASYPSRGPEFHLPGSSRKACLWPNPNRKVLKKGPADPGLYAAEPLGKGVGSNCSLDPARWPTHVPEKRL